MRNLKKLLTSMINDPFSRHRRAKIAFLAMLYGGVFFVCGLGGYYFHRFFWVQTWIGLPVLIAGIVLGMSELRKHRLQAAG